MVPGVAGVMEPALQAAGAATPAVRLASDLTADDLYLPGLTRLHLNRVQFETRS